MNILPTIKSAGAPPEKYADRIVSEMLRVIVQTRIERWRHMKATMRDTPDGHPLAQRKLAKKLEIAGQPFVLSVALLSSGKRGRYELGVYLIDGWDATRKDVIMPKDVIPDKPWLACTHVTITSKGRGLYSEDVSFSLFVTHHALSRLAQRCGAKKPGDLLNAVNSIWWAYLKQLHEYRDQDWRVTTDYRLRFQCTNTLHAFAVLKRYEDGGGGIIVATIVDSI